MSGGIAQLVAVGAQDAHLVGKPEVSFFQSMYKRHTNFSHVVERQLIQGNVSNNGMSTIRFERRGDLLSYVYLAPSTTAGAVDVQDWSTLIDKVELLIGGQVVDDQSSVFSQRIASELFAQNLSKSTTGGNYMGTTADSQFYPLRFFFCENWQSALPLVALQYHDVELRITWGTSAVAAGRTWECFSNFIYLDTDERTMYANREHMMLMYQVQKAVASNNRVQELNFNHPIKFLASYGASGLTATDTKVKLQINGTDITDFKFAVPHFTKTSTYYHTNNSTNDIATANARFLYPFCLETSKLQPTGSLNFSRLDSARLITDKDSVTKDVYAVNYNVLKISNGMAGVMYAN